MSAVDGQADAGKQTSGRLQCFHHGLRGVW